MRLQPTVHYHKRQKNAYIGSARIITVEVTIKDNELLIEIGLQEPALSSSDETLVVASTHGNMVTSAMVDGKHVVFGLNLYIKP